MEGADWIQQEQLNEQEYLEYCREWEAWCFQIEAGKAPNEKENVNEVFSR